MNETTEKKGFKIKIAGFTFGLGHIIAVAAVIIIIIVVSMIQSSAQAKRDQEEYDRIMAEREAAANRVGQQSQQEYDLHAQIQASLRAQFGDPPEGFEWSYTGELVALGDADHTCEDVVYMYLRSLSILDFSTAARYSNDSVIISQYQNYYGIVSDAITDYYRNFLRKQFKTALTSLEVDGISDVAVFADGTEYLTITVTVMDLTDKSFWEVDRDELFQQMYVYRKTETDNTKMEQYVYDYIIDKYDAGEVSKRQRTVELVVTKQNGGGWLVSGDRELCAYLQYENGVDVARYIFNEFESWYMGVILQEQIDGMTGMTSGGGVADGYTNSPGSVIE